MCFRRASRVAFMFQNTNDPINDKGYVKCKTLTEAAGVVFVGYHTGKHTPSFPPSPCKYIFQYSNKCYMDLLRCKFGDFSFVICLQLCHLTSEHRDVGLGLSQQRLKLDVFLKISYV